MSDVEIRTWENKLLELKLFTIRHKTEFWFIGKETASCFGYTNTNYAIREHIFYDYKLSLEDFYSKMLSIDPFFVEKFKTVYFQQFQNWPKKSLILTNELGFYQLANKSTSKIVEPFQRWVYETIKEIREKGYYCLPSIENLSLEERKEAIEFSTKNDIPNFVFGDTNLERKTYRKLYKKGGEKSIDLLQQAWGKIGGDKSSNNSSKARELVKNLSMEDKEYLSELTRVELFEYIKNLVDKSKEIVKEFKT